MHDQPLHEELRYRPTEIESRLRSTWHSEADPFIDTDSNADLANLRSLAFDDFFTRCHRMYATIHPELAEPEIADVPAELRPLAQTIGCQMSHIVSSDTLASQVSNAKPVSGYIAYSADLTRVALLRTKQFAETLDTELIDFAGPERFLQRLWRLCRTETPNLRNVRYGPPIQTDTEIIEAMTVFSNSCFEAFGRRSAGQYLAAVATANNDLHRYVFSEFGPQADTVEEAIKSLTLHLAPLCPFMAAELWALRFQKS